MTDDVFDRLAEELARDENAFDRAAKLPAIIAPAADPTSILTALKQIKMLLDTQAGRSGSVLDKALTLRDLMSADILRVRLGDQVFGSNRRTGSTTVEVSPIGYVDPRPVLFQVPVPTNLSAMGAFRNVILTWSLIDYQNHAYAEIFRNQSDNLATATKIGQSTSNQFIDGSGTVGQTYYYWVRAVALDPNDTTGATLMTGAFNASGGTPAGLLRIGNIDLSDAVITADKIASGAVTAVHFADGTAPVFFGAALPALPNSTYPVGTVFINTTNHKVYRSTGTAWTAQTDGADIVAGTIAASKLIAGTITAGSGVIANAAITNAMIANAAVDSAKIADAAIGTAQIANAAVTTAKIADLTVTNAKIVDLHGGKIVANSVTAEKIDSRNLTVADNSGNVIFSASRNLDWTRLNKRPVRFRVCARGFSDATPGATVGLFNAENGVQLSPSISRSYMFARIRRSDGAVTYANNYDVHGSGATADGRRALHLASDLNATGPDSIAVVYTFDEPQANRFTEGLLAAMLRCGASMGTFGAATMFKSRGAYILVGIGGCGPGNGTQVYRGDVDSSTSAFAELSFGVQDGQLFMGAGTSAFQIDGSNITTYIANSAIGNAQIGGVIQSDNFVAGSSGWRLLKTGSAEFRNVIVRGDVQATSVQGASGTFNTITAGFLRNGGNTAFINLNAVGNQTFLQAGSGLARITADGDAFFTKVLATGTWTGSATIEPGDPTAQILIDTGFNVPIQTLYQRSLSARIGAWTATVSPGRGEPPGSYVGTIDFWIDKIVLRTPSFISPYQELGQNPYGVGNQRVLILVGLTLFDSDSYAHTVQSLQWTLDTSG